jgi:tetratricopeptide (TPR) repeat protein
MIMSNFQVERLKALPQRSGEVWEGGLLQLPLWDWDEAGQPYRPWAALWINTGRGTLHMGPMQTPGRKSFAMALEALIEMATRPKLAGYRPGALTVNDSALAEHLGGLLAEANIQVRYEPQLLNLQKALADIPEFRGFATAPGPFSGKGVTAEGMRAYAEAAKEFYEAAPWRHLNDGDLIEIASPKTPKGLECVVVLGEGQRTYGLSFFASDRQFRSMLERGVDYFRTHGAWSLTFDAITHLPFEDVDLWEDNHLAVAEPLAYPLAYYQSPSGANKRPTARQLVFLEGLLRALARTSEQEMDTGQWTKTVETSAGRAEYLLLIPAMLRPVVLPRTVHQRELLAWPGGYEGMLELMPGIYRQDPSLSPEAVMRQAMEEAAKGWDEDEPDRPLTSQEQAVYLVEQAAAEPGHRMHVRLARMALELDPDNIEAYVELAEASNDLEERRRMYAQGMEIGRRVLTDKQIRRPGRDEQVILRRASYLEAWAGLAVVLSQMGRYKEAVEQGMALLDADPKDETELCYILVPCLLLLGRDKQAEEVWNRFASDESPVWLFAGALVALRRKGQTEEAADRLREAIEDDDRLGEYLAGGPVDTQEEEEAAALEEGIDFTQEDAEQMEAARDSLAALVRSDQEPDFADEPPEYEPGLETDEHLLREAWAATPGALEWLRQELQEYHRG